MSVHFSRLREQMLKEIDRCVSLCRLDKLLSFCNSCIFRPHASMAASESKCSVCPVHRGMNKIMKGDRRTTVKEDELLGVC